MTGQATRTYCLSVLVRPCSRKKVNNQQNHHTSQGSDPSHPNQIPPRYSKAPQKFCVFQDDYYERDPAEYCRKNGLEHPYNAYQLISWFALLCNVILVYILILSSFKTTVKIVFGISYGLAIAATIIVAYIVTNSDPSDSRLEKNWTTKELWNPAANEGFCDLCGPIDISSKHCRACNKCIYGFDHHCKWLNNCIGKFNYKYFLILVVCVALVTALSLAYVICGIVQEALNDVSKNNWHKAFPHAPFGIFWGIVGALLILNIPLLLLDVQLLFFHLYLIYSGLSTPEYIANQIKQTVKESEEAQSDQCCADWIIIDKKRLRRAREKLKETSQNVDNREKEIVQKNEVIQLEKQVV